MLIDQGFSVMMEAGAAESIHYTDGQYSSAGVRICSRSEAFGADIVIHLATLKCSDVRMLRRGALLLTLLSLSRMPSEVLVALLDRHVIALAIDLIRDDRGNRPFGDILSEIDLSLIHISEPTRPY